jgi:hypothetical protein
LLLELSEDFWVGPLLPLLLPHRSTWRARDSFQWG